MWHAGNWNENSLPVDIFPEDVKTKYIKEVADEILRRLAPERTKNGITFKFLAEKYLTEKHNGKKKLSKNTIRSDYTTYRTLAGLHDKIISYITYKELQEYINNDTCGYVKKLKKITMIKQVFRYALKYEMIDKNPSEFLEINITSDIKHGENFTIEDLKKLYSDRENKITQMIIIMCYTGFRIGEIAGLEIDLENRVFKGGIKTEAGKGRVVPIHDFIFDMVKSKQEKNPKNILFTTDWSFREAMYKRLEYLGIKKHTPHDCRHTFSYLCTKFKVDEIQKKRMLGHSFSDVTNSVYGHTDVEILREEIEKIKPIYDF